MWGESLAYLSLCEVQVDGDLVAAESGQVVVVGELGFQLSQLLFGERRALFPGFAAGVHLKTGVLDICRETDREEEDVFGLFTDVLWRFNHLRLDFHSHS